RYLALVLHHDASVRVVPLGLGDPIDKLVGDFRAQLEVDPTKGDNMPQVLASAEALYHSVFQPVHTQFVKTDKNIFLSLDSQLHLVPFAALFDGKQYLVETYQFTYLTSGRDLLRGDVGLRSKATVEVIANPDFMKRGPNAAASRSQSASRAPTAVRDTSQTTSHDRPFLLTSLRPLPGTVQEAWDIRHLFLPAVEVLQGNNATKEAFLGLQSPRILHVATHGMFRPSTGHAAGQRTPHRSRAIG